MQYLPGSTFNRTVFTSSGINQILQDCGAGYPVAVLRRNGVDDSSVSLTLVHNATGDYSVSGTIPSGYVDGDEIEITFKYKISLLNPELGQVIRLGKLGRDQSAYEGHDDIFVSKDS